MEIIHIAAELAPIAKVGGLADVIQGLSKALIAKGHKVEVVLPHYDQLEINESQTVIDSIPLTLIDSKQHFERGKIYGYPDDPLRFTSFCKAALEYLIREGRRPDVIHLHDWHAAVAAPLIKELYPELGSRVVFTIHNLSYQGHCEGKILDQIGWRKETIREGGLYNLMMGGILYADQVTTVSPTYANEILNTSLGHNLKPILQSCKEKFSGILNGLDYGYWNPETDPYLPQNYSLQTVEKKRAVKKALCKRFGLEEEDSPLVGVITRLVPQKGPELIKATLLRTLELGGQFILLGSAPDENTERHFSNLQRKLFDSPHVHLELTYNEELSHLVYAGSDLFVVPSLFEPCGLTQLIAMRYGTVPLVRRTGGLADTVFDGENGFTFGPPTAEAIGAALDRALPLWDTSQWNEMIKTGMEIDYSWNLPAEEYLKLYSSRLSLR